MTCTSTCRCKCHQVGCGCHGINTSRPAVTATPKMRGETKVDPLCEMPAYVNRVKTPAGHTVEVLWCPRCDVKGMLA